MYNSPRRAGRSTLVRRCSFTPMTTMLDPGSEATDADLAKMDAIDAEIKAYMGELHSGRQN